MAEYGVKLLLTHFVGTAQRRFYEEMIVLVRADDEESAFEKAEAYAAGYDSEYTNPMGETVTFAVEAVDCFEAVEPDDDVQEVYSHFFINRGLLSEERYYELLADSCDAAELFPLRNILYNPPQGGAL